MIGREPVIELKSPVQCSTTERDQFRRIVLGAGEVQEQGFDRRFAKAKAVSLLRNDVAIIGIGALKTPTEQYRQKVFDKASASNDARSYGLELGWVVIEMAYRGHSFSHSLVSALVAWADGKKIYATSVATNFPMHRALQQCGFERDGGEWRSRRRPSESLVLFTHNGGGSKNDASRET